MISWKGVGFSPRIMVAFLPWTLGWIALILSHGVGLARAPGFHFDEAWSANFADRIAFEPGFWPWAAQSPYTSPWHHYVIALAFKWLGPNILVFRGVGLGFVILGIALLSLVLAREGFRRGALLFPAVVAAFVPLVLNHRFSIEMTTFHVFCFGLLLFGVSKMREEGMLGPIAAGFAIILGVTSHLLFLAAPVALLFAHVSDRDAMGSRVRKLTAAVCGLLIPFFVKVLVSVPEKDKAGALVLASVSVLVWTLAFKGKNPLPAGWRNRFAVILSWASLPFLVILTALSDGHWTIAVMMGKIQNFSLVGAAVFCIATTLFVARKELGSRIEKRYWRFGFCLVLGLGALMLNPAPRYFEMGFLAVAMVFCVSLELLRLRSRVTVLSVFAVVSLSTGVQNFLVPALDFSQKEASLRFLFLKDNSRDFLPKQQLALYLGESGCQFESISSGDSRVIESLRFLSFGDWPVDKSANCPSRKIQIFRRSQEVEWKEGVAIGQFLVAWKVVESR